MRVAWCCHSSAVFKRWYSHTSGVPVLLKSSTRQTLSFKIFTSSSFFDWRCTSSTRFYSLHFLSLFRLWLAMSLWHYLKTSSIHSQTLQNSHPQTCLENCNNWLNGYLAFFDLIVADGTQHLISLAGGKIAFKFENPCPNLQATKGCYPALYGFFDIPLFASGIKCGRFMYI